MARKVCGIMIGPEDVRAITLKRTRKGFRLVGFGVHDLSLEEREEPGSALRSMLKKVKGATSRAVGCLPKEEASLHYVTLPSSDPEELKGMARFEAERHIPFNAERHSVGYQVLGQNSETGDSEVLLATADGPKVDRAVEAVRQANVRCDGLNVSSACLLNAMIYAQGELVKSRTLAIAAIGLNSLDLVFTVKGRIVFSRSVPHGLHSLVRAATAPGLEGTVNLDRKRTAAAARMIDMTDLESLKAPGGALGGGDERRKPADAAREWAQRLIQDIKRSYDYARREMNCPPVEGIVLAGEGALVKNLPQYLYVNLNVEIFVLNPVAALPKAKLKGLPFGGLELTVPFGAAIQESTPGGYRLDLAPESYYKGLEKRSLIRNASMSSVMGLVAAVLGFFSYNQFQDIRSRIAEDYRDATEEMRPEVSRLREEEKKLGILEAYAKDPSSALAILNYIAGIKGTAGHVALMEVTFAKDDTVTIDGHAKSIADLSNFTDDLRASGLFERVMIRSQQSRVVLRNRPKVYVFSLQCDIPEFKPQTGRRRPKKKDEPRKAPAVAGEPRSKKETNA